MNLVIIGLLILILAAVLASTGIGLILAIPIALFGVFMVVLGVAKGGFSAIIRLFRSGS